MVRHAQESVANAERFLALARRIDPRCSYPAQQLDDAWRNCLLYDEHTWGAYCSISQPETEFTRSQWKIKAQFAVDADRQSRELYDRAGKTLASLVRTDGPAVVVINPSSWPRSDVVRMPLPEGMTIEGAGEVLAGPDGTRYAWVRDVPACGYRVLKLRAAEQPPVQGEPSEGSTIESDVYRVTFDPQDGAITSIVDKELGKELVDAKAPFKLNQYVYAAGGKDARIVNMTGKPQKLTITTPKTATLRKLRFGALGEMMVVETAGTMAPKITSRVVVGKGLKRIDIINRLDKTLTYDKEGVYFAFPFAAQRPTFRYEVPAGVVCANTGMLPGGCREWFTVQHFVEIDRGDAAITWATPDAPLACFQDLNRGNWPKTLDFTNGHVFAYVMNNYWYTNYLAGQGGQHTFRFSITSRPKADTIASARFGAEASNPLVAVAVNANPRGPLAEPAASLVSIDEPNVIVLGTRRAANGNGLMIRLWEVAGRPTTAHVRVHGPAPQRATACNLVEDPQGPLGIHGGAASVPIRGAGLATVIIE